MDFMFQNPLAALVIVIIVIIIAVIMATNTDGQV